MHSPKTDIAPDGQMNVTGSSYYGAGGSSSPERTQTGLVAITAPTATAAMSAVLLSLLRGGDNLIVIPGQEARPDEALGGLLGRWGVEWRTANSEEAVDVEMLVDYNTGAVIAAGAADGLDAIASLCGRYGFPLVVVAGMECDPTMIASHGAGIIVAGNDRGGMVVLAPGQRIGADELHRNMQLLIDPGCRIVEFGNFDK